MAASLKSVNARSTRIPDIPRPSTSSSRISVFSRVVPALRRTDTVTDDPTLHKSPLVTLKFSSQSFLDSEVTDQTSRRPLYIFRTAGTSTSVLRSDPWDGLTKTAEVKWPTRIPTKGKTRETLGALVQLAGGRWQSSDAILKPGTMLSSPPKFNIPNYPHSMRWKRVGNAYWCTTSSVKGPIATFHPTLEGATPRIKVYETLHDKYDSGPVLSHNGVSLVLIDAIILTAMLLVTDVQDWMLVAKYEDDTAPSIAPTSSSDQDIPQSAPASASQWRKILYGEPIFPKRSGTSGPSLRSVSTTDLSKPLPTTSKQMAKILYREPLYPVSSPVTSIWNSDDELDDDDDDRVSIGTNSALPSPQSTHFAATIPTRIHSPSAESMYYLDGRPPSHPYMDPGFYGDDPSIPPVPQIPAQYASSSRGTTPTDSARSSTSRPNSRTPRELPLPPTPISPDAPSSSRAQRSQSTPPREGPGVSFERRGSEPFFLAPLTPNRRSSGRASTSPAPLSISPSTSPLASSVFTPSPSAPSPVLPPAVPPTPTRTLSRSQSMKLRQLPQPPSDAGSGSGSSDTANARNSTSTSSRSQRRVSTFSTRSGASGISVGSARALPVPPGQVPPPLPPLPIQHRKDDLWMQNWGPNEDHDHGEGSEAPPPYMPADVPTAGPHAAAPDETAPLAAASFS